MEFYIVLVPLATSYKADSDTADKKTLAEILSYLIRPISVSIEDGFLCLDCFNRTKDAYNFTILAATTSRKALILMHENQKIADVELKTNFINDCENNENHHDMTAKEIENNLSDKVELTKCNEAAVEELAMILDISEGIEISAEKNDKCELFLENANEHNAADDDDSEEYEFYVVDTSESQTNCETETATKGKIKQSAKVECLKCNKKFTFRENLRRHMKLHSSKSIFDCSICTTKSFSTKVLLYTHLYRDHEFPAPFSCIKCNAGFTYFSQLKVHKITNRCISVEDKRSDFTCEFCSRSFAIASNLKRHLMIHKNIKPFKCTYCPKTFNQKQALIIHERIHSKETPLHCLKCPKQFSDPSFFKKHQQSHYDQ